DRFAGGPPPPRFSTRPTRPYAGPSHYGHNSAGGFYGPQAAAPASFGSTYQSMGPGPDQYDGYGGGYNDFSAAGANMMDYSGGGFGGGYIPPYGGAAVGYDGSAGYYPTPGASGGTGTQIFVRNGAGVVQFDSNESARFAVEYLILAIKKNLVDTLTAVGLLTLILTDMLKITAT
ncbi:8099_t:CDS:2, partial [Racocetra fulgida]